MLKIIRKWASNENGATAVEFAIMFPLMVVFFINVIVMFDGFRASRALSAASHAGSDLLSRFQENLSKNDIQNVLATTSALMGQYADKTDPVIVMASIRNPFDKKPDLQLVCSKSNKSGKELTNDQLNDLDLPYIPEGDSVVLVSIKSTYEPMFVNDLIGTITLDDVQFRRPRFIKELNFGC